MDAVSPNGAFDAASHGEAGELLELEETGGDEDEGSAEEESAHEGSSVVEREGEEGDEGDEDEPVAELDGELQLGATIRVSVPEELIPQQSGVLEYGWHRSADNESWSLVEDALGPEYVLGPEDVGCWLFAEWRYTDRAGQLVGEGSSEATAEPIRLLPEDRDDLKEIVSNKSVAHQVDTREGPAKVTIGEQGVSISYRFGGTKIIGLTADTLTVQRDDPTALVISPADGSTPLSFSLESPQARDLAVLAGKVFASLASEPSFEGSCKVWEGDGYGDYYGRLYGQVLLLFEGADAPSPGTDPDEYLMLHGCKAVLPEDEDAEGFELSIADSAGELFSLCLADEESRQEWKEAIDSRNAPPAIARASHILIKHRGSRRLASWRDPEGEQIKERTEEEATRMLLSYKKMIETGEKELAELATQVSDCDTAKHGGDLGWFAANYMQPEFEEAVLALEVNSLSDVVLTASGAHLILRTG